MTACWDSVVQFHSLQVPPTLTCPSHRRVTLPNVDVTSLKCLLEVLMLPWGCLLKVKTPGLHLPGLCLTHLWGCLLKVNTPGLTWLVPYKGVYVTQLWGCILKENTPGLDLPGLYVTHLWGCLLKVNAAGLHLPGLYLTHLWGCILKGNTPG